MAVIVIMGMGVGVVMVITMRVPLVVMAVLVGHVDI